MRSSRVLSLIAALTIAGSAYGESIETELPADASVPFVRSDCAADGRIDLADAKTVLLVVFQDAPVVCEKACDVNADGRLTLQDAIQIMQLVSGRDTRVPLPFPQCGVEGAPTAEITGGLHCHHHVACE